MQDWFPILLRQVTRLWRSLRKVWADPVGSKIIAGLSATFVGQVYYELTHATEVPSFLSHPITLILVTGLVVVSVLLLWQRRRSRLLIFLSAGGTCRDPMAKAIFLKLIETRKPSPQIQVCAAGLVQLSSDHASYGARQAMREMFGEDLLENHQPVLLTEAMAKQASLILVMDKALLMKGRILPQGKSFLLTEFVGQTGDVDDPWPDGRDPDTLRRYYQCALQLRGLLEPNVDRILSAMNT